MKTAAFQAFLIARAVWIELSRKRGVYVAVLLMALFVVGAVSARIVGVDKPSVGTFLLNLGLSLSYYAAHILTLLLAAGQLPNEIENRTLYPLLAKPVSRGVVLFGKWAACSLAGCAVFIALGLVAWIAAPKMEAYDSAMLLQMLAAMPLSIALLAALSILFSLVWSRGVALVLLALIFVAGNQIARFLARALPPVIRGAADWIGGYVPNFSNLNLITRYTDGIGPLANSQLGGLLLYSLIFLSASLALSSRMFDRRPL